MLPCAERYTAFTLYVAVLVDLINVDIDTERIATSTFQRRDSSGHQVRQHLTSDGWEHQTEYVG